MMAQPFNYELGVKSPMEVQQAAYQGQLKTLATEAEMQRAMAQAIAERQRAQQAAELEARKQAAFERLRQPDVTALDYQTAALLGNKDQAELIMSFSAQATKDQQRAMISKLAGPVYSLAAGKPDRAVTVLQTELNALPEDSPARQELQSRIDLINNSPQAALTELGGALSLIPGGENILKNVLDLTKEQRTAAKDVFEQRELAAKATTAEAEAQFARQQQIAKLKQQAASLGLTAAQTKQALAQTSNLTEQGRMLALDYKAAAQGLPIPSKGGGTKPAAAATEDERKAAGWLAQADNAYRNMLGAMYTKEGKPTGAEKPGVLESIAPFGIGAGITRSTNRQKFVQGSESLGEAILRAATGAGVNKDEAAQKSRELTPVWSDDEETRQQKLAAIPMYLRSLQTRAGRAAPEGYELPQTPKQRNVTVDY